MFIPSWPNVQLVTDEDYVAIDFPEQPTLPEIPPEVWNDRAIDPEQAMRAVRAMSRG